MVSGLLKEKGVLGDRSGVWAASETRSRTPRERAGGTDFCYSAEWLRTPYSDIKQNTYWPGPTRCFHTALQITQGHTKQALLVPEKEKPYVTLWERSL